MTTPKVTPEECAANVIDAVPLVMQYLRVEMRRQGGTNLLSIPQFRALRFLSQYPGASLSNLAEHLGVTRATASSIVERLVRRGLIERVEDHQERRRNVHTLTPVGAKHLQQARDATRSRLASLLAELPDAKLRQVAEGATLLKDVFKDHHVPN